MHTPHSTFFPTELCLDGALIENWLRAPFGMRHLLLLMAALMILWAFCVAVRRLSEPAAMTDHKWHALRILSVCSPERMSASEIAHESRGYLSAFMLALQLRQLEGFGLVRRWDRSRNRKHDTVYDLTPAGRALLAGVAWLDQFGILRLNELCSCQQANRGRATACEVDTERTLAGVSCDG